MKYVARVSKHGWENGKLSATVRYFAVDSKKSPGSTSSICDVTYDLTGKSLADLKTIVDSQLAVIAGDHTLSDELLSLQNEGNDLASAESVDPSLKSARHSPKAQHGHGSHSHGHSSKEDSAEK